MIWKLRGEKEERGKTWSGKLASRSLKTSPRADIWQPADKRALPKWRYNLRQQALPLVRWETPYLAALQSKLRTPALDSYFAITANLGTHTFFMIFLPMLFWGGYAAFAKGYVLQM